MHHPQNANVRIGGSVEGNVLLNEEAPDSGSNLFSGAPELWVNRQQLQLAKEPISVGHCLCVAECLCGK